METPTAGLCLSAHEGMDTLTHRELKLRLCTLSAPPAAFCAAIKQIHICRPHPHTPLHMPQHVVCVLCAQVIFRAGAYLDLASNDGAALLAASDSAYDLSGLSVEVKFARCNLPPHTIMRGPGYLQGCMVMEQVRLGCVNV